MMALSISYISESATCNICLINNNYYIFWQATIQNCFKTFLFSYFKPLILILLLLHFISCFYFSSIPFPIPLFSFFLIHFAQVLQNQPQRARKANSFKGCQACLGNCPQLSLLILMAIAWKHVQIILLLVNGIKFTVLHFSSMSAI